MDDLIEALTILRRYQTEDTYCPTHCEHDILYVYPGFGPEVVSEADLARLEELGFKPDPEFRNENCWSSYRFGSA